MSTDSAVATRPLLDDGLRLWHREEIEGEVDSLAAHLRAVGVRVLATSMDNTPAWIIADLAAAKAGIVHVPLPLFFAPDQVAHAVANAGVDGALMPAEFAGRWAAAPTELRSVAGQSLALSRLQGKASLMPVGTAKITFTSGTTGTPKGVCLSADAMRKGFPSVPSQHLLMMRSSDCSATGR